MRDCIRLMREVFKDLRAGVAENQARRRLTLPTGSTLHTWRGLGENISGRRFIRPIRRWARIFSSCCSKRRRLVRWLSSRPIFWARSGPARRRGMRPTFSPRRTRRRWRSSAAGFRRGRELMRFAKCVPSRMFACGAAMWREREKFAGLIGATVCETAEHALRGADMWRRQLRPRIRCSNRHGSRRVRISTRWDRIRRRGGSCPPDLIARAALIAIDSIEQGKIEAGDLLLAPVDWTDPRIIELAQVEARPAGSPVTIFKSLGLGVEDVAAAAFVYERYHKVERSHP